MYLLIWDCWIKFSFANFDVLDRASDIFTCISSLWAHTGWLLTSFRLWQPFSLQAKCFAWFFCFLIRTWNWLQFTKNLALWRTNVLQLWVAETSFYLSNSIANSEIMLTKQQLEFLCGINSLGTIDSVNVSNGKDQSVKVLNRFSSIYKDHWNFL